MGCGSSKGHDRRLQTVDDSVHVMLKHDKKVQKAKGDVEPKGYVPRAEHPLLKPKAVEAPSATNTEVKRPAIVVEEPDD